METALFYLSRSRAPEPKPNSSPTSFVFGLALSPIETADSEHGDLWGNLEFGNWKVKDEGRATIKGPLFRCKARQIYALFWPRVSNEFNLETWKKSPNNEIEIRVGVGVETERDAGFLESEMNIYENFWKNIIESHELMNIFPLYNGEYIFKTL